MIIQVHCQHCGHDFEAEVDGKTTICPACQKETPIYGPLPKDTPPSTKLSRDIENECQFCGQRVSFPEEGTGQKVDCPGCGKPIALGMNPVEIALTEPNTTSAWQVACKHCGKRIVFPILFSREVIDCPHCEVPLFLGEFQGAIFGISQDEMDALRAATKLRVDDRNEKNRQIVAKYGNTSHPVFEGMSFLVQLLVVIGIILIILAFAKFVLFWDFE